MIKMTEEDMNDSMNESVSENSVGEYTGRVKWFNKKKGYGFITLLTNDEEDKDVFFHYSSIVSDNFKILFPGEYVSFDTITVENKVNCTNIRGIMGNELLIDNKEYHYKVVPKNSNKVS